MISEKEKQAILSMVHKNRFGESVLALENSRLDFSSDYLFRGFTANGVALAEDVGGGPDGIQWKNRLGKVEMRNYDGVEKVIVSVDNYAFSLRIPIRSTTGSGWHKHSLEHHDAAIKGVLARRGY